MNGGSDMTLAFELAALENFAYPEGVFNDAREWSTYIGIVSDEPTYVVTNFTRKNRVRQDFFSGPRGKAESLQSIKEQFDTERHVFVGASEADEELAEEYGWEFLHYEDAGEAAGWPLLAESPTEAEGSEPARDDWP
ncbi:DUF7124 domain-containing protein [Natronobeatus ordinarius]|uniref:DUF7124 domain-containing protein n=1 Tax=Natronobeatus ordinarius TaxID=2963433 RepID=UPI0020CF8325|nr:hypothetical protein [Natronobeatus ordinarius]